MLSAYVTSFSTAKQNEIIQGDAQAATNRRRQFMTGPFQTLATCFRYPTTLAISTDSISTVKTNSSFHKTQQILLACLHRIPSKATKEKADSVS